MGPPKLSYERIAPPNSFIHVQDFKTPKDLAMSVTIASFFKTLSSIHNGNHFQVPVTLGLSSRGISEIPWSVKIIAINQFSIEFCAAWKGRYKAECVESWGCELCREVSKVQGPKRRQIPSFLDVWTNSTCYSDWTYQERSEQ